VSKEYFDSVSEQWDTMRASFFSEFIGELAIFVSGAKTGRVAAGLTGVSVRTTRERCLSSSCCGRRGDNVGIFLAIGEK